MTGIDPSKSLGGNFMGRGGLIPYGSDSMILGGDQGPQGKVGMFLTSIMGKPSTNLSQLSITCHVDH